MFFRSPKKKEIIQNSHPDRLYVHSSDRVKFYRAVLEEDNSTTYQASTRTQIQLVQKLSDGEFDSLEIVKLVGGEIKGRVTLPKFTLEKVCGFLHLVKDMGVDDYNHRRSLIAEESVGDLSEATKEAIVGMLSGMKGTELVQELMDTGALNERDIVNTGYRRQQLGLFYDMLYSDGISYYKQEIMGIPNTKEELAWQHFFAMNPWIFGYGLDYRFNTILQKEFAASGTTAAGKEQVNADFLVADTRFTAFVELKKPTTPLFGTTQNRARAWGLSRDLQDAKSQILEQKASGQIKAETERDFFDDQGNPIHQRTFDPKVILVIGSWSEIASDDRHTKVKKQKTFELYRRDSRNVEFITFDELYERACHIVGDGIPA